MTYTENYALNQWAKTDRIQMSDFNADNAKLDAALSALGTKSCFEKLKEVVTAEASDSLSLDLSDIDWAQWQVVRIDLELYNAVGGSSAAVNINGDKGGSNSINGNTGTAFLKVSVDKDTVAAHKCPGHLLLLPFGCANAYIRGLTFATDYYYNHYNAPYSSILTLDMTNSDGFSAGCRLSVWAMR